MATEWTHPLVGGVLIGFAVSLMLLSSGRVAGISGIVYGLLRPNHGDMTWRIYFLGGLLAGGMILRNVIPDAFGGALATSDWTTFAAALLVGFGTVLGSGCTSGHGVCGVSRLSPRSIAATVVFVLAGVLSVLAFKKVGILP